MHKGSNVLCELRTLVLAPPAEGPMHIRLDGEELLAFYFDVLR